MTNTYPQKKTTKTANRGATKENIIQARQRRRVIERLLLSGVVGTQEITEQIRNSTDIRTVGKHSIANDIKVIEKRWARSHRRTVEGKRAIRHQQLAAVIRRAAVSYERSTQDARITKTRTFLRDGQSVTETTIIEKGQSGDAAFLNVMLKAITEQAKLDGLYVQRAVHRVEGTLNIGIQAPNVLTQRAQELTADQLIAMLQATSALGEPEGLLDTVDGVSTTIEEAEANE